MHKEHEAELSAKQKILTGSQGECFAIKNWIYGKDFFEKTQDLAEDIRDIPRERLPREYIADYSDYIVYKIKSTKYQESC